jgi:hypothetical protein
MHAMQPHLHVFARMRCTSSLDVMAVRYMNETSLPCLLVFWQRVYILGPRTNL